MSEKIWEDIYQHLKKKWWGTPAIALGLLFIVAFAVWNSLPDSTKEKLLISENTDQETKPAITKVMDTDPIKTLNNEEEETSKPQVITHKSVNMKPGTGFIFSSQKTTSGTGVDRDIWWNRRELVPASRMYSLGKISDISDIVQVASGEFKRGAFTPQKGEGYALEIKRKDTLSYAILRITSIGDRIQFEWLYPFGKQISGRR